MSGKDPAFDAADHVACLTEIDRLRAVIAAVQAVFDEASDPKTCAGTGAVLTLTEQAQHAVAARERAVQDLDVLRESHKALISRANTLQAIVDFRKS